MYLVIKKTIVSSSLLGWYMTKKILVNEVSNLINDIDTFKKTQKDFGEIDTCFEIYEFGDHGRIYFKMRIKNIVDLEDFFNE